MASGTDLTTPTPGGDQFKHLVSRDPNTGKPQFVDGKSPRWMNEVLMNELQTPNYRFLFDANGIPNLMVRVPMRLHTHASGFAETSTPHPAFLVNGSYVDEIWVAPSQCIVVDPASLDADGNPTILTDDNPNNSSDAGGSVPTRSGGTHSYVMQATLGHDPFVKGDWDFCKKAADNMNGGSIDGFHMMTDMEWDLLTFLEKEHYANGGAWAPGNCDHGRDIDRKDIAGTISQSGQVADGSHPSRILTGSMAEAAFLGIFDRKGNVWEWTQGKIQDGVLIVPGNTNTGATGVGNSFAAAEGDWYNTGIDITAGMSSGNQITAHRTDIEGLLIPSSSDGTGHADYDFGGYWFNATGERLCLRGAHWYNAEQAAAGARRLSNERSDRLWYFGVRAGFAGSLASVT